MCRDLFGYPGELFWLPWRIILVALENYSVALEIILVALGSPGWLGNFRWAQTGRH